MENHHTEDQEAVASSHEQQQQQQDSLWTLPSAHTVEEQGGQDAGGQDAGGQGMDSTTRADSTEKSLGCGGSALGTDDKKVLELEDEFGLRISDTPGSASTGATPTDTGFGPEHLLASSNTPTATTEACGNDNADLINSTQVSDTSNVMDSDNDSDGGSSSSSNKSDDDKSDSITRGLTGTDDGQNKQQSGDQPNVTSDDQIMNSPSVDVVDSASYGDTINNLPPASTLEHTSTQPIAPGTDDERPGGTNDNDDDDDDDDIPLMAQYEGDPSTILPSASTTTTTTTSLSISAGRSQAPLGTAAGDQQLTRVATTGSDEQTLSEPPRPRHVWESDRQASECRRCNRRFSFLVRRHHCR
jgi:hypothetical protein